MTEYLTLLTTRFACGDFFGLHPWYQYLPGGAGNCGDIDIAQDKIIGVIPLIGLAVLDDLLRIAGVAAVAFVLYGAFQYVTSQGSPDGTRAAQDTILNAIIGLIIAIVGISFVSYLGNRLGA